MANDRYDNRNGNEDFGSRDRDSQNRTDRDWRSYEKNQDRAQYKQDRGQSADYGSYGRARDSENSRNYDWGSSSYAANSRDASDRSNNRDMDRGSNLGYGNESRTNSDFNRGDYGRNEFDRNQYSRNTYGTPSSTGSNYSTSGWRGYGYGSSVDSNYGSGMDRSNNSDRNSFGSNYDRSYERDMNQRRDSGNFGGFGTEDSARYAGLGSNGMGYGFGSSFTSTSQQTRSDYTGRGPKGYRRSDDRIKEDVSEMLERHPDIDASEIEIDVKEGVVSLRGTVGHRAQKRMAEDAIEHMNGVKDVRNDLNVDQSLLEQAKEFFSGEPTGKTRAQTEMTKTKRH